MKILHERKVAPGVYLVHPAPAFNARARTHAAKAWLGRMKAGVCAGDLSVKRMPGRPGDCGRGAGAFVIDTSVSLAWYRPGRAGADSRYAAAVYCRMNDGSSSACAPALWRIQMTSALLDAARRGRISDHLALAALADAESLPVALYGVRLGADAMFRLGRKFNADAFESWHLELARRLKLPIASISRRVRAAARKNGVSLYRP